jgi:hypothetical protein
VCGTMDAKAGRGAGQLGLARNAAGEQTTSSTHTLECRAGRIRQKTVFFRVHR